MNIQAFFGNKRLVRVNREDFVKILLHNNPTSPLTIAELSQDTQDLLKDFSKLKNSRVNLAISLLQNSFGC